MGTQKEIKRCVIIAGGKCSPKMIEETVLPSDYVICADSGYYHAAKAALTVNLLVGDFDSFTDDMPVNIEIISLPAEKDDTDLHFAAETAVKRGFNEVVLMGAYGSRPDQNLAAIQTLNWLIENGMKAKIVDEKLCFYMIKNSEILISKISNSYFSCFSFGEAAYGVHLKGFKYPLVNATVKNTFPIGVSNEFSDDIASVTVKNGTLLIMIVDKDI